MHRVNISVAAFAVALSMSGSWDSAEGATVEAMTLDQMVSRAEIVFVGRAVDSRAEWNVRRTRIYTHVTFEVERFLKGGFGETHITIRLLGGQVGALRSVVPGTPKFSSGEEVLLFCVGSRGRLPTLLGLALGKFTLSRNATGEKILKRDISGLVLANYRTDSRPVGTLPTRYRLSEVESRIRAALAN